MNEDLILFVETGYCSLGQTVGVFSVLLFYSFIILEFRAECREQNAVHAVGAPWDYL